MISSLRALPLAALLALPACGSSSSMSAPTNSQLADGSGWQSLGYLPNATGIMADVNGQVTYYFEDVDQQPDGLHAAWTVGLQSQQDLLLYRFGGVLAGGKITPAAEMAFPTFDAAHYNYQRAFVASKLVASFTARAGDGRSNNYNVQFEGQPVVGWSSNAALGAPQYNPSILQFSRDDLYVVTGTNNGSSGMPVAASKIEAGHKVELGNVDDVKHGVSFPMRLARDGGKSYVMYLDGPVAPYGYPQSAASDLVVARQDSEPSGAWTEEARVAITQDQVQTLAPATQAGPDSRAFPADNMLFKVSGSTMYLVGLSAGAITVFQFQGTTLSTWATVMIPAMGRFGVFYGGDDLYVAFVDTTAGNAATVAKVTQSGLVPVGKRGFAPGTPHAVFSNGKVYVGFVNTVQTALEIVTPQ